jgi:LacI family transcriptional regulator, xylobiose transport system transcriptional regulator
MLSKFLFDRLRGVLLVRGGWHVTEGQEGGAELMRLPVPPTAIVAPNDMAAIGAITKLKEMKLKVPEDVAVVGFDNITIARWYDPPLTTVEPCKSCSNASRIQVLQQK